MSYFKYFTILFCWAIHMLANQFSNIVISLFLSSVRHIVVYKNLQEIFHHAILWVHKFIHEMDFNKNFYFLVLEIVSDIFPVFHVSC